MASENSSEDEFETLHGPVRPYLFQTDRKTWSGVNKVAAASRKSVLGSFDNVNFKFVFLRVQTLQ